MERFFQMCKLKKYQIAEFICIVLHKEQERKIHISIEI